MATTLTSSYKYIGRSNAVSCPNGYKYYILLYAKTSPSNSTGDHTVTVKQVLACTSDSTFHNWDTTGYVKVNGTTAFSWSNARVPLESWSGSSSLTVDGTTYKRHTTLKEGSAVVDTNFNEKTVTIESYWKMEDSNSAGWFPQKTPAELSASVTLSSIATASTMTYNTLSPKMGGTLEINVKRSSTALTHTLTYEFGTKTGTIASGVGASKDWTIPDLAVYCNNALSRDLKITCKTYSGSTLVGETSRTITLYVPDPTVPTVDKTSAFMGTDTVRISTPRESSNFTHRVTYKFGDTTGLVSSNIRYYVDKTFDYDLASEIPSATSATCTIYCTTYNGTATVGEKTVTLTLKVPDNETTRPTFTYTLAPSPDDVVTSGFVDRLSLAGKYVKGKSKLTAVFDAKSSHSTIAAYSLKVDGVTKTATTGSITSDYITNYYGTLTVTLRVTDARGYHREVTDSISVLNWVKPYIDPVGTNAGIVCARQAADAAPENAVNYDYLYIAAKRVYTPMAGENVLAGSSFTQGNLCTLRCCYKKVSDSGYGEWLNLIHSSDLSSDEFVGIVKDANGNPIKLNKTDSYDVWIQVYDATNTGTPHYATVPTDYVTFHLGAGGKKAAFGKYAEEENALEIADDWKLHAMGDVEIDGSLSLGGKAMTAHVVRVWSDSNNIRYRLWSDGRYDFWGTVTVTPTTANQSALAGLYYTEMVSIPLNIAFTSNIFAACPVGNYAWTVNSCIVSTSEKTIGFRLMRASSKIADTSYDVRLFGHGNT